MTFVRTSFLLILTTTLLMTQSAFATKRADKEDEHLPQPYLEQPVVVCNQLTSEESTEALDLLEQSERVLDTHAYRTYVCHQMIGVLGIPGDPDSEYTYRQNNEIIESRFELLNNLRNQTIMLCDALFRHDRNDRHIPRESSKKDLLLGISNLRKTLEHPNILDLTYSALTIPGEWSVISAALQATSEINLNRLRFMGEDCIKKIQACYLTRLTTQPDEPVSKLARVKARKARVALQESLHSRLTRLIDLHLEELCELISLYRDTVYRITVVPADEHVTVIDGCSILLKLPPVGYAHLTANHIKSLLSIRRRTEEHFLSLTTKEREKLKSRIQTGRNLFRIAVESNLVHRLHERAKDFSGYEEDKDSHASTHFVFDTSKSPQFQEYNQTYRSFKDLITCFWHYDLNNRQWDGLEGDDKSRLCATIFLNMIFEDQPK